MLKFSGSSCLIGDPNAKDFQEVVLKRQLLFRLRDQANAAHGLLGSVTSAGLIQGVLPLLKRDSGLALRVERSDTSFLYW